MRLWHIDLLPYLPKSQLVAQWRELNSIYKKQDRHILINYIYDYPKEYLGWYSDEVIREMTQRGMTIRSFENYKGYFGCDPLGFSQHIFREHNFGYLRQCYFNLEEKYQRGQKDFDRKIMGEMKTMFLSHCKKQLVKLASKEIYL